MDAKQNDSAGNAAIPDGGNAGDDAGNKQPTIDGIGIVDPGTGNSGDNPSANIKRGRGRPPGSGTGKRASAGSSGRGEKASAVSVAGVEKLLYSIHQIAGTFVEEMALEKEESKQLAEAMTDVGAFYNQVIDPKIIAWVGLLGVCGKIYGPRAGAFMMRKKMESESDKPSQKKASVFSVVPKTPEKKAPQTPVTDVTPNMMVSVPGMDI